MRVSIYLFFLHVFGTFILKTSIAHAYDDGNNSLNCSNSQHVAFAIGGVVEKTSGIGREQKIAMVDFCRMTSTCSCLTLHLKNSQENSVRSVYKVMDLMEGKKFQALIGAISPQEAILAVTKNIPIIFLSPTATSSLPQSAELSFFVQMSHYIRMHMQCVAESSNTSIYALCTYDATLAVAKVIQVLKGPGSSMKLLKNITHTEFDGVCSSKSFKDGKLVQLPTFSLINGRSYRENNFWSPKFGLSNDMHGNRDVDLDLINWTCGQVARNERIPLKTGVPAKGAFKQFVNVSYDADIRTFLTSFSIQISLSGVKKLPYSLFYFFIPSHGSYDEMVGEVHRKTLDEVVGDTDIKADRSMYVDFSHPYMESGIFMVVPPKQETLKVRDVEIEAELYLESGTRERQTYMSRMALESKHKPLKVGVPAKAIFNQFVKVSYDQDKNKTYVSGTSIDVLEAVMKELPYSLSYVIVPYKGTYDSLVAEVYNEKFDMAIGDIEITADRYKHSQFSQPYMETELVRVVPVKKDSVKEGFIFIYAFTTKMWLILLAMTVGTVSVVWFNEHIHGNEDFDASSTLEYISRMLWFAVAVLSLSHREMIKNNLSRLVLATWFCVNMIVAVCFTATLSSIITDSRFRPSLDLHRNNYVVGCNENSFVCRYLVDVLHYSPKNIRQIQSIEEYRKAFNKGEIEAAFFVSPHANVFLAKFCQGYEKIGPTIKLRGFGFVLSKGSTLVGDISEAVLKVAQTGEIDMLEKNMLRSLSTCSQLAHESNGPGRLDSQAFTGLFILSGCISAFVFFTTLIHLIAKRQDSIWSLTQSSLITGRVGRWLILLLRTRVVHDNPGVELIPTQAAA